MRKKQCSVYSVISTALALCISAHMAQADKVALESGNWPGVSWSPPGDPRPGDLVRIGNGSEIHYVDAGMTRVGRIYIGSTGKGNPPSGSLTLSAGELQTASNGSLAIQVGQANDSTGVLNVTGGKLVADSGGWITVGNGVHSTGTVNLSSGSIRTNERNLTLGSAEGSTGVLNMSGGTLDIADVFFVGRTFRSQNTGRFVQSGGEARVGGRLRVGNATAAGHQPSGSVSLTGGRTTVMGDIAIANTVTGQLGEGKLSIGFQSNLSVTGEESTLILGGDGVLEFVLGPDENFNAVDLTQIALSPALSILEDSRIIIDGSALVKGGDRSITLISYPNGFGPSSNSQSNVEYEFIGFGASMEPRLEWTDTGLVLILYPEF